MELLIAELLDAWRVNCAINHQLLSMCSDREMDFKPGSGKTIRSNFVHIAGVRRMHLEEKMRKEASLLPKPDWKTATRDELTEVLIATDQMMEALFEKIAAKDNPGRWPVMRIFAYTVAHDAHHRSQIEIALRINGHDFVEGEIYAMWDWPKIANSIRA